MKYIVILITAVLAFIAGTQVSSANGLHMNHAITQHSETSLMNSMASEWLIPDNAARMMAYHKAFNK